MIFMNKLKLSWFLFGLAVVLAIIFCVGMFIPNMKGNILFQIAMGCGLVSQVMQAASMLLNIRSIKRNEDN